MAINFRQKALCFYWLVQISIFFLPAKGETPFVFHHLTTKDGLSNSSVNAILKDSYGFLWVATLYGLNRYDGYEFKVYTTASLNGSNTMVANNIWGLKEDGEGNIWTSSFNYMVYLRNKDNLLSDVPSYLKNFGIHTDQNFKVYIDGSKDLWVFSAHKAFHYNFSKKTLQVFTLDSSLDQIDDKQMGDDENFLYVLINQGDIVRIDKKTGKQSKEPQEEIDKPEWYYGIYVDSKGGLWLTGRSDVVYYKRKSGLAWKKILLKSESSAQYNRVLAILDDKKGNLWMGTDHNGIFIYNLITETLSQLTENPEVNSSIASNNISCLYYDHSGILWIGHNKKGISYHHPGFHNIVNIKHPECRDVSAILEDSKGNIWLGTDGNGLFLTTDEKSGIISKLPIGKSPVVSLFEDRNGRVWVGTFLDGLYCFDNDRISHYTSDNSILASNDIWSFEEDRYDNLWIGSLAGAVQILRKGQTNLHALESTVDDIKYPMDMFYDDGDKLYIATVYGLRIADITTGTCSHYLGNIKGTQNFKQNLITTVFKDSRHLVWLGHNDGLSVFDMKKDTLYYINKDNGLRDNIIQGISEDAHGNVWVITTNGLSVVTIESNFIGYLKFNCRNFTSKDGLGDHYFNNHSIYRLRNGDFLLGGTEGYSVINPNKLLERSQPPSKVIFTSLSVNNILIKTDSVYNRRKILEYPIEQTSSLTFRNSDRQIVLQYTTGNMLFVDKIRFEYKLDGFHSDWQSTSDHKISFSSLAPGDYKFNIRACTSDGVCSDQVSSMAISVSPPFYLSVWAFIVYLLAFIGVVTLSLYFIVRKNYTRLEGQKMQHELEQKANLDEMKLRFFTNVSHDLRTPLTLILTPLQTLLDGNLETGIRKKLETIYKSAGQLQSQINALLDFRKLDVGAETLRLKEGDLIEFVKEVCIPFYSYSNDRKISFSVSDNVKGISTQFDHNKIKKILINLLSNAFKFTPDGGKIRVHLFQENDNACIAVADTGEGINETEKIRIFERFYQAPRHKDHTGSGIGLHIVSEYVKLHGGSVRVEDNNPKGSVFIIKLPIINAGNAEAFDKTGEMEEEQSDPEEVLKLPANPVLLFVDDNKDLCEFMSDSLADEYTVLLAHNGQQALDLLQENEVAIVVSDVMMPVLSGTELCERIKTTIQWSHIPVILLTARAAEEHQIKGLEIGADDYLTKPFNLNVLKLRIRKFIEWTEKCHHSFSQKLDVSPSEITITPLDEQLIAKAIHLVEERIGDPDFSVEELGMAVGLSRSHLYKKLMGITGKGPAEFIRTLRLKRGRQLLEKSQMQIAEIAYAVGFNSPKRFTINFKNEFGMLPSDYVRGLNRQNNTSESPL